MKKYFKMNLSTILFEYTFIMVIFSNYIGHLNIWYMLFILILSLTVVRSHRFSQRIIRYWLLCTVAFILVICSAIFSSSNEYLLKNLIIIEMPTLMCISLSTLGVFDRDKFKRIINSKICFINIWWIINLFIIIVQVSGYPLMIKQEWIMQNPLYKDLCCGLFGYNRTHELAFFSCMVLVCNLSVCYTKKVKKKIALLVYTVFTEAIMLICSVFNDNTAFFMLLPTTLLLYLIIRETKKRKDIFYKIWHSAKYGVFVIIALFLIVQIPVIKNILDTYILVRLNAIINYGTVGVAGSNERIAIIKYALNQKEVWHFGNGIGSEIVGEHMAYGFRHFGISSLGIFIWLGGIWYCIVHTTLISKCLTDMCGMDKGKERKIIFVILTLFVTVMSLYSPIFNSEASLFWIFITFAFV